MSRGGACAIGAIAPRPRGPRASANTVQQRSSPLVLVVLPPAEALAPLDGRRPRQPELLDHLAHLLLERGSAVHGQPLAAARAPHIVDRGGWRAHEVGEGKRRRAVGGG